MVNEAPHSVRKYVAQRHTIWSKYDEGIWMTDKAWFGVTPEPVAKKIAEHVAIAAPSHKTILIDAFAGAGGNAIAFARSGRWTQIFAIETDPDVMLCARHNAAVYGVEDSICWIQGDCFEFMRGLLIQGVAEKSVIFGSPPWGGVGYKQQPVFDLSRMKPYNLADCVGAFTRLTNEIVLYLPRQSDLNQLAVYAVPGRQLPVGHYCIRAWSKAICVFFGDFAVETGEEKGWAIFPPRHYEDQEERTELPTLDLEMMASIRRREGAEEAEE